VPGRASVPSERLTRTSGRRAMIVGLGHAPSS
jgi:hypothetical protein